MKFGGIIADTMTTKTEALQRLFAYGQNGQTVFVATAIFPVLGRINAATTLTDSGLTYRFPPPRSKDSKTSTTFSFLTALLALAVSTPFMLVVALMIIIANGKNPFFTQQRYGQFRRPFTILKFRTLSGNKKPLVFGRFLRAHGIDELPQLLNILKGEMAWFGPRPLPCDDPIPQEAWFAERYLVKPGLTGLYQICPERRSLSVEEMAILDIFWIRNTTPALCLTIFFRTIRTVIR